MCPFPEVRPPVSLAPQPSNVTRTGRSSVSKSNRNSLFSNIGTSQLQSLMRRCQSEFWTGCLSFSKSYRFFSNTLSTVPSQMAFPIAGHIRKRFLLLGRIPSDKNSCRVVLGIRPCPFVSFAGTWRLWAISCATFSGVSGSTQILISCGNPLRKCSIAILLTTPGSAIVWPPSLPNPWAPAPSSIHGL